MSPVKLLRSCPATSASYTRLSAERVTLMRVTATGEPSSRRPASTRRAPPTAMMHACEGAGRVFQQFRDGVLVTGLHEFWTRLRRVDDGGKAVDAKHAQVEHREAATLELLWLQPPCARTCRQLPHLTRDSRQRLLVSSADDGS